MFEPIHGSAFDITGKGVANPVATFWTAAMMLEHLGEKPAADRLMKAVEHVTADPALHTPDLGGDATAEQVTEAVCEACAAPTTETNAPLGTVSGRSRAIAQPQASGRQYKEPPDDRGPPRITSGVQIGTRVVGRCPMKSRWTA